MIDPAAAIERDLTGDGRIPTIRRHGHGGRPAALKWDGQTFR